MACFDQNQNAYLKFIQVFPKKILTFLIIYNRFTFFF